MGDLAAWFMAMAGPLATRVLSSLGIGWLTYAGWEQVVAQATAAASSVWGGIGGAVLAIATLVGVTTALGIMLGAVAARVAIIVVNKVLGRVEG